MRKSGRCWHVMMLLGCGLILFSPASHAADRALEVRAVQPSPISLTEHFAVLQDPDRTLTLADVRKPDRAALFTSTAGPAAALSYGFSRSAYWLRLTLRNSGDQPLERMLEIAYARLTTVEFHRPAAAGAYQSVLTGYGQPFGSRPYANRFFVFPVTLPAHAEQVYYLRVQSTNPVIVPAQLWEPQAFHGYERSDYLGQAWYYGMATAMILFNLLLFVVLRDGIYLLYVSFVTAVMLTLAAQSGTAQEFLWPQATLWSDISFSVGASLSVTILLLFMRRMLDTATVVPRVDRGLKALIGLSLFNPIGLAVSIETFLQPFGVLSIATLMLILGVGLFCAIVKRQRSAYFFVGAFAALLLGAVVAILRAMGWVPTNVFTVNGLQFGSTMEMILLAFALADRFNESRREKEAAQAKIVFEQARVQALQQSQERYRSVIEHVGEGMVVVQDERIVFVNLRAAEILEASKASIIDEGVLNRLHVQDRDLLFERMRLRLAGHAVPERYEARLVLPDRRVKWLEFGDNMVPWDSGQGLLIYFQDVTQRHEAELEIRSALDRQQELNDLRSRFVSMTSHEFRTPLAAILSSQDLLEHYSDRLPDAEKRTLLATIKTGVDRMTSMLDRVLLLGKAEARMLEFKPRKLDLKAFCGELLEEARSHPASSDCQVLLDFSGEHPEGEYDEKLLRHILGNLLSNAIKYSPAGGEVRLNVRKSAARTILEVSDRGIGIPLEEIGHLFESFHRASNVGSIAGTGLGLAIVKQSVELHGGRIDVQSVVGLGSTFTVTL